jgi:hypothetical protein
MEIQKKLLLILQKEAVSFARVDFGYCELKNLFIPMPLWGIYPGINLLFLPMFLFCLCSSHELSLRSSNWRLHHYLQTVTAISIKVFAWIRREMKQKHISG